MQEQRLCTLAVQIGIIINLLMMLLLKTFINCYISIYKISENGTVQSLDLPDSSFTAQTSFVDVSARLGYFVSTRYNNNNNKRCVLYLTDYY